MGWHQRDRLRGALLWTGFGVALGISPFVWWIAQAPGEFWQQAQAQAVYQASRFPGSNLASSAFNELPGRYLISRRDQPEGWWFGNDLGEMVEHASTTAGQAVTATERGEGGRLVSFPGARWVWVLALLPLARWVWFLVLLVVVGQAFRYLLASRTEKRAVVGVIVPLLIWLAWLAANPDKWQNYAGTASAYLVVAFAYFVWRGVDWRRIWGDMPVSRRFASAARWRLQSRTTRACLMLVVGVFVVSFATNAKAIALPSRPYRAISEQLRKSIPPGPPVVGVITEWFTFGGRNPFYAIDLRSLPGFGASLDRLLLDARPEYLVLRRLPEHNEQRYEWVPNSAKGFLAYVDADTELVNVIPMEQAMGTIEVRRALRPFKDPGSQSALPQRDRDVS